MAQNAISGIPVEIFSSYIIEKLRRSNPFMAHAVNESSFVLGGAVVHIPQSGAAPSVVKNRKSFPATAVRREDSYVTYALNVFTTDPTHVTWHESNELSYDKTDSVLRDHVETLAEAVGDEIIYGWLTGYKTDGQTADTIPASSMIKTSGNAVNATQEGQTGQRKAFTYKELQEAQAMMNKHNVPKNDRYVLIESYMLQQFIDSLSANQMAAFQQSANLAEGIVGRFAGFNVIERSEVAVVGTDGSVKVPGEALAAADNLAAVCWQKDCVAVAMGDTIPFSDKDNPSYYGDIFSALVKAGSRCRRGDWKGVVAIVQAAAE